MAEQARVAPGWYPNSVPGEEQWWDGTAWAPQRRQVPAGIGFSGSPETLAARRTYWTGWSRDASLAVGIVLAVLSIPAALLAILGVLSFSIPGLFLVLIWLLFAGGAVVLFVNYYVRGKQLAAIRAGHQTPANPAPPTQ